MERFVLELSTEMRSAANVMANATTLKEHARHDTVHLSRLVSDVLTALVLEASAESQEVLTSARANIMEKLEDNG